MNRFVDICQRNLEGYPRTIYKDEKTRLEVWKFNKISILTLLICNTLLTEEEKGVVDCEINGVPYLVLSLPSGMAPEVRHALDEERFEAEMEEDVEFTDDYLVIYLGITITDQIGALFDKNGVQYDKTLYKEFKKEWYAELDRYMEE